MAKEKQNKKKAAKIQYESCETYYEQRYFNLGRPFFGAIIILAGLFLFLNSFGLVKIDFDFWRLWPIALIFAGLACLNRKSLVATWAGVLAIFATIFFVALAVLGPQFFYNLAYLSRQQTNEPAEVIITPPAEKIKVNLFYYNRKLDEDITCGADFVFPVEREIAVTGSPIKDTINLLIKGELTEEEKEQGYKTQFPDPDFKLLGVDLKDGILTLNFNEVPGFTSGGACKMRILSNEIVKTAKQFQGVKDVVFMPESLFQP